MTSYHIRQIRNITWEEGRLFKFNMILNLYNTVDAMTIGLDLTDLFFSFVLRKDKESIINLIREYIAMLIVIFFI